MQWCRFVVSAEQVCVDVLFQPFDAPFLACSGSVSVQHQKEMSDVSDCFSAGANLRLLIVCDAAVKLNYWQTTIGYCCWRFELVGMTSVFVCAALPA